MHIPTMAEQEHHLRKPFKRSGLKLWQARRMLQDLLGGIAPCESELSKMLLGQRPMSEDVEQGLKQILEEMKKPIVQIQ